MLKIDYIRFDTLDDNDQIKQNILRHKRVIYKRGIDVIGEIFWKDYFYDLGRAVQRLHDVATHQDIAKNDYMQDAAIQRFEFVVELFWKVLKKILSFEKVDCTTPRDVLSKSFQFKLINDEEAWLNMLDDRNSTLHNYKYTEAIRVLKNIESYLPVLEQTYDMLKKRYDL